MADLSKQSKWRILQKDDFQGLSDEQSRCVDWSCGTNRICRAVVTLHVEEGSGRTQPNCLVSRQRKSSSSWSNIWHIEWSMRHGRAHSEPKVRLLPCFHIGVVSAELWEVSNQSWKDFYVHDQSDVERRWQRANPYSRIFKTFKCIRPPWPNMCSSSVFIEYAQP